ncbi:class I SAM-dependent methyltransferase [Maridesulfovibrio sp.]|uniref:class I SAM-dependent methyltransferase n=1 Tax=Maridesulfovibrio sp. TaxID=2795000 RepID=UPI002AA6DDCD|nr:class I SAM-dependent methyltransferase [Maridesulfovibrio sp.]
MNKENHTETRCNGGHGHHGRHGRGPSSFWMQDPDMVFMGLALKNGTTFLELGCGPGDYCIRAAQTIGPEGMVYGLDSNVQRLTELDNQAKKEGFKNIRAVLGDMLGELPFEDDSVDFCLMSTSLHCVNLELEGHGVFKEIRRVLKFSGQVAVLECKKEKSDFGPPLHMRISDTDIKTVAEPLGFSELMYMDLGYNYLIRLKKEEM